MSARAQVSILTPSRRATLSIVDSSVCWLRFCTGACRRGGVCCGPLWVVLQPSHTAPQDAHAPTHRDERLDVRCKMVVCHGAVPNQLWHPVPQLLLLAVTIGLYPHPSRVCSIQQRILRLQHASSCHRTVEVIAHGC